MKNEELSRDHERAFRTEYAELKERLHSVDTLTAGTLGKPGKPGSIKRRVIRGSPQVCRVTYARPGDRGEAWVAAEAADTATATAYQWIEFARWVETQVKHLHSVGFQVADKIVAKVLYRAT